LGAKEGVIVGGCGGLGYGDWIRQIERMRFGQN